MRLKAPMTPWREKLEQERLRIAIWRWYRLGGSYETILRIAEVMYATKAASQPTEKVKE